MKSSFLTKIGIIVALFGLTFLYALHQKNKFVKMDEENVGKPVLSSMPSFNLIKYPSGELVSDSDFKGKSRGLYFHIWGSWCGPCEEEMPQFLQYAEKVKNLGVNFLLVAVNDKNEDVVKFMKRFPNLPSNVTIAVDLEGKVMEKFGTFKVPETFLFNKESKNVNKFVGPQDWLAESYVTRLDTWLGVLSEPMIQVETH